MNGANSTAPELEDAEASRSHAELTDVLREIMPELLRYFGRRVADAESAADCLGETMVVLWRRRDSLPRDREGIRRFAFGVAVNVLRRSRRDQVRQVELSGRLASELDQTQQEPHRDDDHELRKALRSLRTQDRELVLLVAWEGFGVGEAGAILGLSSDAARARYSRVRARLRGELGRRRQ